MAIQDHRYFQDFVIDPAQVDADLTDFPVFLRGSDLPATHLIWTKAKSAGEDVKASLADDTEIPIEIVDFDQAGTDFEIHTKYEGTLSSTTGGTVRLNFGNPSGAAYAEGDTYGREAVWNANYRAVLHLGETANNDAGGYLDSTANDFDGTGTSMTSQAAGQLGIAADFINSTDGIDIGDVDLTGDLSISCWLRPDSVQSDVMVLHKVNSYGLNLAYTSGGIGGATDKIGFHRRAGGSWSTVNTTTSQNASAMQLIHGVWDGTNSIIYYNGSSETTGGEATATDQNNNNADIGLGIDGLVDELRISSVALAASWISTEYNNQDSSGTFYSLPPFGERHRNKIMSAA
jgi:hypothetical protein